MTELGSSPSFELAIRIVESKRPYDKKHSALRCWEFKEHRVERLTKKLNRFPCVVWDAQVFVLIMTSDAKSDLRACSEVTGGRLFGPCAVEV
jgi:hypothetical protein